MQPQDIPFITGWYSFGLGQYRPCNRTYCYYKYDTIPPLDMSQFQGKFDWLKPPVGRNRGALATPDKPILKKLTQLQKSAKTLGITLPAPFLTFMQNTTWQNEIPSCTACYFDLSEAPIPDPLQEEHTYIRFLNDQQGVLMWYLYLKPDGDSCVAVSPILLDDIETEGISPEVIKENTIYCSETFESFIYRFWLENTIWFALDNEENLSKTQKSYLAHYQKA